MQQWSTTGIPAVQRTPYWIEAVNKAYVQLECSVPGDAARPFFGAIARRELAALNLSRIRSTEQTVIRTPLQISQSSEDIFLLSIQAAGNGKLIQDKKTVSLQPGDLALYDSTRPYQLLFNSAFEQYVLSLPGGLLRQRLHNVEDSTACKITVAHSSTARVLAHMITELLSSPPIGGPRVDATIANSVLGMLIATLAENLDCTALSSERPFVRRDKIKSYTLENLRDPELNIAKIGARLGMTASTIHRAWEDEPESLNSWIWSMRLAGARQHLYNEAYSHLTITEIAYHWGFSSSAHFSRAFRKRFGSSPKQTRSCIQATK